MSASQDISIFMQDGTSTKKIKILKKKKKILSHDKLRLNNLMWCTKISVVRDASKYFSGIFPRKQLCNNEKKIVVKGKLKITIIIIIKSRRHKT